MDSSIIVSIIIPVYNMEEYLPKCIDSLNRQKFSTDVEILFINDGSTDSSGEIIDKYHMEKDNVKVFHQKNAGVSSARNLGLKNARGKYIAWIDPDDYITDDWWNTIKLELLKNPDMIFFDMYVLENENLIEINFEKKSRTILHNEICNMLAQDKKMKSHLWSKVIRRDFFEIPFSLNYSYCEDFALMHHVMWHVKSCQYIHKPLYIYRQLYSSIVHDRKKILSNYLTKIKLVKERYEFYASKGVPVSSTGVYLSMIDYCYEYKKNGNDEEKRKYNNVYQIIKKILCKKFVCIVFSRNLSTCTKIKILSVIFGIENCFIHIFSLIKQITK